MIENKIREAERLGFDRVVIPKTALKGLTAKNFKIKIDGVTDVKELSKFLNS